MPRMTPKSSGGLGYRALLVCALALALWALAAPGLAQAAEVRLELSPLEPVAVGDYGLLHATLSNLEGRAQDNKVLVLSVAGRDVRRVRTGVDGTATFRVRGDLPPGSYPVSVTFIGTRDYLPATAQSVLVVRPLVLTLETVPPLPGIPFRVGGVAATTGADGRATVPLSAPGAVTLEVALEPETRLTRDTRVSFLRWGDSVFDRRRTLTLRGDARLQVGLALSHPVRLTFTAPDGGRLEPGRVASVALQGSNGTRHTLSAYDEVWLQANRVQRLTNGMINAPIRYSVESVMMDGANVVNRYQHRFLVEPGGVWPLDLLLYSLRVRAQDALLGWPVGRGVHLTYPDGASVQLFFDERGEVAATQLARGLYQLKVFGVRGLTPVTPVALSRDQDVSVRVLSALDIALGGLLAAGLALGLLLYGRPHLVGLGRRTTPPYGPEAG